MTNNQIHATEVTNQSIPIAISARHCHVNEEDFYYLFGRDAALQKWKELSQPGQFASQHVLTIKYCNPSRNQSNGCHQAWCNTTDSYVRRLRKI